MKLLSHELAAVGAYSCYTKQAIQREYCVVHARNSTDCTLTCQTWRSLEQQHCAMANEGAVKQMLWKTASLASQHRPYPTCPSALPCCAYFKLNEHLMMTRMENNTACVHSASNLQQARQVSLPWSWVCTSIEPLHIESKRVTSGYTAPHLAHKNAVVIQRSNTMPMRTYLHPG